MAADLRVLETANDLDQKSVVETLECALAEAREGQIRAIGLAIVRPNISINAGWSDSNSAAPLLGAATLLQHRLALALDA